MGKCNVCGKHGLFLKTNHDGLCKACELAAYQKQVADLQEKINQLKSRRENEEALLAQAISRAEKQAAEKTEPLFRRADELKNISLLLTSPTKNCRVMKTSFQHALRKCQIYC